VSKTIYIVTSGCYSDYAIDAVFSTREQAEAYVAGEMEHGYHSFTNGEWVVTSSMEIQVEEYEMDAPVVHNGAWRVTVDAHGNAQGAQYWAGRPPTTPAELEPWGDRPKFVGYGETIEHARRSAEEFRRAWLTSPAAQTYARKNKMQEALLGEFRRQGLSL
jgi:hypothetical protein